MFNLTFNTAAPAGIVLLLFAGLIFALNRFYRKTVPDRRPGWVSLLHLLAFGLLFTLIAEPEFSFRVRGSDRQFICVLVDNSLSMGQKEANGRTRLDQARELLGRNRFFKDCRPLFFSFGKDLARLDPEQISGLQPVQNSTRITRALTEIQRQYGGKCSAVLLLSDGNETEAGNPRDGPEKIGFPVYPVGIGDAAGKDAGIIEVISNSPVYEGEKIKAGVYLNQSGLDGRIPVLVRKGGQVIGRQDVAADGNSLYAEFELPPDRPGDHFYQVVIPPSAGETNTVNNSEFLLVRVLAPKIRLLYIEGAMRWEYKFLKRYLESDGRLEPVFLVRVGENLFQQTGGKEIEVPEDILAGEKFLDRFDILIIGDLDFSGLSSRQAKNLTDFVREKGRGVMFLGGDHFLNGSVGSGLADLLPVTPSVPPKATSAAFAPALTEEAKSEPVFQNLQSLPALTRANEVNVRKGSLVILDRSGNPDSGLLVAGRFARGKCLVFASDDTWQWAFGDNRGKKAYNLFWSTVIRYLRSPEDYLGLGEELPEIIADRKVFAVGEEVAVRLAWKNETARSVPVWRLAPGGEKKPLTVQNNRTAFTPDQEGVYLVGAGGAEKTSVREIIVRKEGAEFAGIGRNESFLKKTAEITGGEYFPLEKTDGLKARLKTKEPKIYRHLSITRESSKYLAPAIFLLLSACWWLRRRNNIL